MKTKSLLLGLFLAIFVLTCGCNNQPSNDEALLSSVDPFNESLTIPPPSQAIITQQSDNTERMDQEEASHTHEHRLIVNGQDITEDNHVVINHDQKNAEIPILAIFRALGHDAQMCVDEHGIYQAVIDQSIVLLDSRSPDFGLELNYNEKGSVRERTDDDFIIDTTSISTKLYWGWDIDIKVDFEANVVYVNSFDPNAYEEYPAKLIVNNKDITEGNNAYIRYYYNSKEVELPLLAIVKELGAKVTWNEESIVTIKYKKNKTTLDLTKDDFDCMGGFGDTWIRKATDTEIYMELFSVENIISYMMGAELSVDYDNHIIYIYN